MGDGTAASGVPTTNRVCFWSGNYCLGVNLNGSSLVITNGAGSAVYTTVNATATSFSTALAAKPCAVSFSATPTFSNGCYISPIVLTGSVTSSALTAGVDGQQYCLNVVQNATGGFTFAYPTN